MERFFKRLYIRSISNHLKIISLPYTVLQNSVACVANVMRTALAARKLYKRDAVLWTFLIFPRLFDETTFCQRPVAEVYSPVRLLFTTFSKKSDRVKVQLETSWLKF